MSIERGKHSGLLFDDVTHQRDQAISRVQDKAERTAPGFTDDACAFVEAYLGKHGPTSGEVITRSCKEAGIVAHDDRAMGAVFMRLARRGVIVKAGHCVRTRGHGTSGGNVWALGRSLQYPQHSAKDSPGLTEEPPDNSTQ